MSQQDLALLLGLLGSACAVAATLAYRGGDVPRDVALILVAGCTLGLTGALLHVT